MRFKLVAAITAAMWLFSGVALAEKPNSYCTGFQDGVFIFQASEEIFVAFSKYCDKAPKADAAKFAEKLNKKSAKLCEKYNSKLAKANCATEGDPDLDPMNLPEPIDCSGVGGFDAGDFTGLDPACNGADDPP